MPIPILTTFGLNESYLYRIQAAENIKKLLTFTEQQKKQELIRQASSARVSKGDLVQLFVQMLNSLNMETDGNAQEVMHKLMGDENSINKEAASSKTGERSTEIKISSKKLRDSHFDVDVAKEEVFHEDKRVLMVSCYVKDAYLGRYRVKRNFFFATDRGAAADEAYDEIVRKMKSLKDRYYEGIIDTPAISVQAQLILEGVVSELRMNEDEHNLGTTLHRKGFLPE